MLVNHRLLDLGVGARRRQGIAALNHAAANDAGHGWTSTRKKIRAAEKLAYYTPAEGGRRPLWRRFSSAPGTRLEFSLAAPRRIPTPPPRSYPATASTPI